MYVMPAHVRTELAEKSTQRGEAYMCGKISERCVRDALMYCRVEGIPHAGMRTPVKNDFYLEAFVSSFSQARALIAFGHTIKCPCCGGLGYVQVGRGDTSKRCPCCDEHSDEEGQFD